MTAAVPVEAVLQGLRERGPDAYRPGRAVDTWDGNCPQCLSGLDGKRTLRISQNGVGARLRCDRGCKHDEIVAALNLSNDVVAASNHAPEVTFDGSGKGAPKLKLPDAPAHDDTPALCTWLTAVFTLNPARPIIGGSHEGVRGPDGHVVLHRAGAPPIRFEPASKVNTPARLDEVLTWQKEPQDARTHGFKGEHCHQIAYVVRMLCGASKAMTDEEETQSLVSAFLQSAEPVEGYTTYGTGSQRYEAATALQRELDAFSGRPMGVTKYLIDDSTGEIVTRVQDLGTFARQYVGSSLARGWLDGRMQNLGWQRATLDGHALGGRAGRAGPHARVDVYRGLLTTTRDEESVTT